MNFYFSIRPRPEKRFLEGSGDLGDITIIMGRPRSGKSLFLRYLFSLFVKDRELAQFVSSEILEPGGRVTLKIGDNTLDCSKPTEDETAICAIDTISGEKAYLFYEGWLFTAKYGRELLRFPKIADAMRELFDKVSEMRGRYRYDIRYRRDTMEWIERVDGQELRFDVSSSAVVTVGVLERALQLDAWLLLDGTLDDLFPEEVLYLAGVAASSNARIVVATHSPWVLDALRCSRIVAEHLRMPVMQKSVKAYDFTEGMITEIGLSAKTYGDVFEKLYVLCG
jgi:predicted ATPase